MPTIHLATPLKELAGGADAFEVEAASAGDAIRSLERAHPRLVGRVLDERGKLRPHVNLFVNDSLADLVAPIAAADRIYVLQAVSGGALAEPAEETEVWPAPVAMDRIELLVGTKKGLVVLRGRRGLALDVAARAFPGEVVEFAAFDRRSGRYFAAVTHGQFGPRLSWATDPTGEWTEADGPRFPEGTDAAVERIWIVQPGEAPGELWAGVAPAALFRSGDDGSSWELVRGLWDHPARPLWSPGGGGLCLHSISPWPGDPARLLVAVSAGGVWRTGDGGATWESGSAGLVPRYLPDEARQDTVMHCVHNLRRSPVDPERLFLQFHGGVYRSDDAGASWLEIGRPGEPGGLPADFGFPIEIDPEDPDRAFVIPLAADFDRVTPGGKVQVYETADAGATWQAHGAGLPDRDAYLTVLRQAFCRDDREPLGLYFGATSGEVFASADAGATWVTAAERLPPVTSVRCGR